MMTALRRVLLLAFIGGAAYALWAARQRRQGVDAAPAEWPPIPRSAPAPGPTPTPTPESTPEPETNATVSETGWADPSDGACPDGFPIKVNMKSGIYHVPGGRFYDRSVPDRCYATAEDAEADGYRAAKA